MPSDLSPLTPYLDDPLLGLDSLDEAGLHQARDLLFRHYGGTYDAWPDPLLRRLLAIGQRLRRRDVRQGADKAPASKKKRGPATIADLV